MVESVKLKWLLFSWCQMEVFESAASSFISWSLAVPDRDPRRSFNIGYPARSDVNTGFRIKEPSSFPSITAKAGTDSKTRIACSTSSASYGNTTIPSLVNSNENEPVEIPIIGPLLNIQKPIIVGDSVWLNPPTPLQWKAVEVCITAQNGGTIMNWKSKTASEIDGMVPDKINLATIAKSPLVAILNCGGNEYATLAAIEGIATKKHGSIDTSDTESFRESLASLSSPYYSDSSKIRLMAIGRAKVSHLSTKFLIDDCFIESHEHGEIMSKPLLVARMELLFDSNENGKETSSPVHALNRLSTFAQRVRFLHESRQRIVRGLQAAQSKLEMAMENWEDWDGIGSIKSRIERPSSPENTASDALGDNDQTYVLNQFLDEHSSDKNIPSMPTYSLQISNRAAKCLELENYGLGTTSSAFVSLTSMTDVLMERLENYYSPTLLQSELFEYEAFSWCALQSLKSYLSSQEINEALYECTNTCARLEIAYHAMVKHKIELNELAQAKVLELRNCGEECDLF